jgi:hypothetical protein
MQGVTAKSSPTASDRQTQPVHAASTILQNQPRQQVHSSPRHASVRIDVSISREQIRGSRRRRSPACQGSSRARSAQPAGANRRCRLRLRRRRIWVASGSAQNWLTNSVWRSETTRRSPKTVSGLKAGLSVIARERRQRSTKRSPRSLPSSPRSFPSATKRTREVAPP